MTQPNIPNITPTINIETLDVINIILASIGLEELALAHLINAEAEKIQYALGTLDTGIPLPTTALTFDQLLALNRSTSKFLLAVSHKELVLLNKLNETIDLFNEVNEQVQTQCTCSATINAFAATGSTITIGGTTNVAIGALTTTGEICPNCTITDSTLTITFVEGPVVGTNDSYTFVADDFNQPSCVIDPLTGLGTMIVTGEGNLTFNSTTSRANFSLQLIENAGNDQYIFTLVSQDDPTFTIFANPTVADASITLEDCNG
jgi:hypothetical protein